MRLGSSACNRALSAWESRRNDPPEDGGTWYAEEVTCWVNGKRVMHYGDCGEEGSRTPRAKEIAARFWFSTKRGALILEAYKELHGSGNPRMVCDQETMLDWTWSCPTEEEEIHSRAMEWAISCGLIKRNVYTASGRDDFHRTAVTIGGVKAVFTSRPCEAPEYDPY